MNINRLLKYGIVGGIGFVESTVIFYILTRFAHLSDFIVVSGLAVPWVFGLTAIVAILSNYLLNSWWTFKQQIGAMALTKFSIVSIIGLFVSSYSYFALTRYLGVPDFTILLGLTVPWALLFSTIITTVVNFSFNTIWTFRAPKTV